MCLVTYVFSCFTWLVPYVLSCFTCFIPYMLLCFTCFMSYVPSYFTCLVPYRLSCLSRVARALVPHLSDSLFYFTFLVSCVFSCCSCLVPLWLLSLTCFRRFKSNMLIHISLLSSSCIFVHQFEFLKPWLRLSIVICHFQNRNAVKMVFRISDISLQDS